MKKNEELQNYIIDNNLELERIVDDYTPYIRTVIENMVGNNLEIEDKEEILLDTFFILWKKYKDNYDIESLKLYMAGITRNLIKEKLKALHTTIDLKQCENLIEYSSLDNFSQEREEISELYKRIKNLKKEDFNIIIMFYYENKSIKDIAKKLKISQVNVKTKLHRIRKRIRQELKQGGF